MKIECKVDIDMALKVAAAVLKKLPYVLNDAIVRTGKEMVVAGKQEIAQKFTVRKKFIQSRIRILQYSRVSNLTAVIGIDRNVQGSPLLLGFFEEGGEKEPTHGSDIAVPITGGAARPEFEDAVKAAFRYQNLQITEEKGKRNTFVIPGIGVFRRVAKGGRLWDKTAKRMVTVDKTATQIVYAFRPNAPLRQKMDLTGVMLRVIQQRFSTIFAEEFAKEITHKRGQS